MSGGNTLGGLISLIRRRNGWTLRELSERVGIPLSTLAKVETDKLSLTYDKLQQFTSRLGMSMTEFLGSAEIPAMQAQTPVFTGRKSVTAPDTSIEIVTPNYDYRYLCADLTGRRMVPIRVNVKARSIADFGEPVRHRGEEFIYVLEGQVEVHLQFYRSIVLGRGQGIYLDSSMAHAYTAKDCESAVILAVCSCEDVNLADELISLAESGAQNPT